MLQFPIPVTLSILTLAASATMALAPVAGADEPAACDHQQAQQQTPEQQHQCQDQGAAIAREVVGEVQQGAQDAQKQIQNAVDPNTGQPYPGRPMRMLLNGVETCWPLGVPTPPGATTAPVPGDMTGRC